MAAHEVFEFGACVLDAGERRLSKAGAVVTLPPRAHDLLVALVRRAGALVTKEELLDAVWRDAHVEEAWCEPCSLSPRAPRSAPASRRIS